MQLTLLKIVTDGTLSFITVDYNMRRAHIPKTGFLGGQYDNIFSIFQ